MIIFNIFYIIFFIKLFCDANEKVILTKDNFVTIKNVINEKTRIDFIKDITLKSNKNKDVYIIIDSEGGSVFDGQKIIEQINFLKQIEINIKCIALNAYSMAFHIFQSCTERIITESSKLMSHQIRLTIKDIELYKLKNYLDMIYSINEKLDDNVCKRINVDKSEYREKIYNDWWIDGKEIIKEKLADKIVYLGCDKNLYDINENNDNKNILFSNIEIISYKNRCPL